MCPQDKHILEGLLGPAGKSLLDPSRSTRAPQQLQQGHKHQHYYQNNGVHAKPGGRKLMQDACADTQRGNLTATAAGEPQANL